MRNEARTGEDAPQRYCRRGKYAQDATETREEAVFTDA
jgi:hypothetical protein